MPDSKSATTPASAPAPANAAPKPAAISATAPRAKPAAAPAPTTSPLGPPARKRSTISAKKALGLEEEPRVSIDRETKRMRGNLEATTKITELPVAPATPPAPAEPDPEPVALPDLTAPELPEPAPAAPAKIKVGDKEYTAEELVAENARLAEAAKKAAPAPASEPEEEAAPPQPPPQPPPLTKEEVTQREAQFVATTSAALDVPLTEDELDLILAGGKDAVAAMKKIRQRDMAVSILQARKGVAEILNPIFDQIFKTIQPLEANHKQLQMYNVEQQFVAKHKDFAPHVATARQVAQELGRRFPQQVAKMTHEQFVDEVARQTDVILANEHRRWFPTENGNWRKGTATPATTPAPIAPAPVAATPAPAGPVRTTRAPAGTSPTTTGAAAGAAAVPWSKSVAASLRG